LVRVVGARAQVGGLEAGPVVPTFRLPTGSLDYLDRKQYAKNMEVVSHISGSTISGGEPLMALWARGKQRLLPAGGGFVDISDAKNPVVMNKGVIRGGGTVTYNTKLKKWIMMCTSAAPLTSATPEFPDGAYDKPLRDKSTGFKGLRGIRNYDITDPAKPVMLQEFSTGEKGNGTHHNFYDGGKYAYLDCGWDDQLRLENTDFCFARGRFGSHNTQCWLAPGAERPEIMAIAWFNAGVRVFGLSNPTAPKEVASFVPPRDGDMNNYDSWWRGTSENCFVEWDRNRIWVGCHEGSYCLSCPALGKPITEPRKVDKWSVAHCNVG
jgi:hypothetical protein